MKDAYYSRPEVSNSMLTELKKKLQPGVMGDVDPTNAFRLGTLVDAMVTEPSKVDWLFLTVDDETYTKEEFEWGKKMVRAIEDEAKKNPFISLCLTGADHQKVMINKEQPFEYNGFEFKLDTRCKWDFWFERLGFGGDLKTTSAETQEQFEEAIDRFDWDRSRAWYMDIAGSQNDFIVAISKKHQRIFTKKITRSDDLYNRGREKYLYLAYKYYTLYC